MLPPRFLYDKTARKIFFQILIFIYVLLEYFINVRKLQYISM